jgi:hypothetical protein
MPNDFDLSDRNWRSFPREKLDELNISHNELWFNTATKVWALIVRQSNQCPEHALSVAGIRYLADAVQQKKITAGVVATVNRYTVVFCSKPVEEVSAEVGKVPPRPGPFGDAVASPIIGQVPHLLGISGSSGNFFTKFWNVLQHLPDVSAAPALTGILCLTAPGRATVGLSYRGP